MNSLLALLICVVGIAGLFYLDREKAAHISKAVWLPVIWLAIVGSRPVTAWLGQNTVYMSPDQLLDGSPLDRYIYEILLGLGITVLISRGRRARDFLWGSWPILLYFSYCLLSLFWSDYPEIVFKRWIKALGDLVMVLIILTDAEPAEAFKRFISRLGFVLLPASILLIKYFGDLGRAYDPDGDAMNVGVSTNKNSLGVITLVIVLGALWNVLALLRDKQRIDRGRHLLAQFTLLAFGFALLEMAHSATCVACFILGAGLILANRFKIINNRPAAVHVLVFLMFLAGGFVALGGGSVEVAHVLGRESNLTGRTDVWQAVIPVVPNPMIGAGFESFWLGPRLNRVWSRLSQYMHVNEAHNGYLEVYLNLGWVGIILMAFVLAKGYKDIVASFRHDSATGALLLAYLFGAIFYSITEAGFRLLNPMWIFLLFAIVAAGAAQGEGALQPVSTTGRKTELSANPALPSGRFFPVGPEKHLPSANQGHMGVAGGKERSLSR
jgi:O-antigen ligase